MITKQEIPKIIILCLLLFLSILGLFRIYELNSTYYKTETFPFCKPKGVFGLGYECDVEAWIAYQESLQLFKDINFTFADIDG